MAGEFGSNTGKSISDKVDPRDELVKWIGESCQLPFEQGKKAFWDDKVTVLPSGQASLATLYAENLLDCKRSITGGVNWYIGARWVPFTRVRGALSVLFFYWLMVNLLIPSLFIAGSKESYQAAFAVSLFMCIAYFFKGFQYTTLRLLTRAVPGNHDFWGHCFKAGLYHMGWIFCAFALYVSHKGHSLSGDELEAMGLWNSATATWDIIASRVHLYWVILTEFDYGIWAWAVDMFSAIGRTILFAFIVGLTMVQSENRDIRLMQKHGHFAKFEYNGGQWLMNASFAPLFGLGFGFYSALSFFRHFI